MEIHFQKGGKCRIYDHTEFEKWNEEYNRELEVNGNYIAEVPLDQRFTYYLLAVTVKEYIASA